MRLTRRTIEASVRDAARSYAAWVVLVAISIDALALVLEPTFLVASGAPVRAGLAATLEAWAFSACFALGAAVPLAALHAVVRGIGRRRAPWRFAWPLPLAVAGWVVVLSVAPHKVTHTLSKLAGEMILTALFVVPLVLAVLLARVTRTRFRVALGIAAAIGAVWADVWAGSILVNEPRDLLWLQMVLVVAAVLYPWWRSLVAMPHERASRAVGVLLAASVPLFWIGPLVAHDWRTYASGPGRFAPRMARFTRVLADFDDDGFSSIAWGTDCDDLAPSRNPLPRERVDGIDRNCNGKVRPATSTPAERGLAPPAGEPDMGPGEIDRVVLVTIDCLRSDAFTREVMPNLARLSERGLRFAKLYTAGARTSTSLPFVLRGSSDAPTVATVLATERVSSTAIFGYRHGTLEENVFEGFAVVKRPDEVDHRMRAPEVTDLALANLKNAPRGHFAWVHYFDAHAPRTRRVLPASVLMFPPLAGETPSSDSAVYLSDLAFVDAEIGRLVAGLEAMGGLGRTILLVTSDHGEGFGRHGVHFHGVSAFEEIIHVPGFVLAPGIAPGTYPRVVSQRDIAPTILGAFGMVAKNPSVETFARSWLRLRAAPGAPLHEFAVTYETTLPFERWADAPMASIVDDHRKLSASYVDGLVRFYDLDDNPGEGRELSIAKPAEAARYRDALELFRDLDAPPY